MRLRALACEAEGAVSGDSQARCLHVSEVETLFGISRSFEVRGESPRGSLDTVTCASEPRGCVHECLRRSPRPHAPDRTGPERTPAAATAEPEARGGGAFFQQNPRSAHFVTQTP